jgi:hypothetical protein
VATANHFGVGSGGEVGNFRRLSLDRPNKRQEATGVYACLNEGSYRF